MNFIVARYFLWNYISLISFLINGEWNGMEWNGMEWNERMWSGRGSLWQKEPRSATLVS